MTAARRVRHLPVSVADVERLAAARLPRDVWDFVAGGSGDERTMAANRAALDRVCLVPRVLTGTTEAGTASRLVGTPAASPMAVAPMAYQRLLHPDGELAAAAAARDAGVPFVISTLSSHRLEDVVGVGASCWFQLYWLRERAGVLDLVRRAEDAGCTALMVTVDVPAMGRRLRDVRNEFTLPRSVTAANLATGDTSDAHLPWAGVSAVARHTGLTFEPAVSWADLEWLRGHTTLPLVLKGILDPRDAVLAVELGARGVVVSNHGGRQLAGAVPSVAALPGVLAAVGGRLDVLLDSGVRGGTDILRALALGASGVLVGRPVLWGLASDGQAGVALVLDLLSTELREALLLAGCADLDAARGLATVLTGGEELRNGGDEADQWRM
jgi:4-hydroxymandelate oxidase